MLADWMPTTERGGAQGLLWMSSRIGGADGAAAAGAAVRVVRLVGGRPGAGRRARGASGARPSGRGSGTGPRRCARSTRPSGKLIASGRADRPAGHGAVPWRRMLTSRSVWALCLMYGALGYSGNFFLTLLPDYLRTHRGLDAGQIQWLTSLPFAIGVGACLAGGALSDLIIRRTGSRRWGRRIVGAVGMAIAGAAILATLWVESVPLLGALLCLTFLGNDLAMGPAWAAAADKGERHAGTLGGLMNMTASLTAALAAIVTGHLFESGDVTLPFVLFAVSYAIGVLCWLRVDVTHTLAGRT